MILSAGVHYIDQLMHLTGFQEVTAVQCRLVAAATLGDADDVVKAWLTVRSCRFQLLAYFPYLFCT